MSTQIIERLAVEVEGSGPPVVMIHGLGGTSNTFTPQLSVLNRQRVIRPDLPGSGRSPGGGSLSIQRFVDVLARVITVLGAEGALLVGHSLGTIVCQHLAAQHPRLVRSMVLLGPIWEPPSAAREALKQRAAKARAGGMADIADAIVAASTARQTRERQPVTVAFIRESLMRQTPDGYAATCEALAGATAADLARIGCPVWLITGDEDAVAPPSVARTMAERLRRGRVDILNRCGHWTPLEASDEVNRRLRDVLARQEV